jgi:hypothetical protein
MSGLYTLRIFFVCAFGVSFYKLMCRLKTRRATYLHVKRRKAANGGKRGGRKSLE